VVSARSWRSRATELDIADTAASVTQDRTSSGRVETNRITNRRPSRADEIDRPQALELCREPGGVLVHRRSETVRAGAVEPGQR
jgi:hypothetical protein